ncbi:MAG: sporulation protein YunB [Porcipelethomonas sp.]
MRKKAPVNKKRTALIIGILFLIIFVFVFLDMRINSSFKELSRYYCRRNASDIISTSVNEILEETGADYSDFAVLIYDEKGRVVSAETISSNVNAVQTEIINRINDKLASQNGNKIKIPVGTASGFYLLSGRGPEVSLKFLPAGDTQTSLSSSFTSAGINQTCHKIIMDITVDSTAVYPGGKTESTVTMSCILAETVIVGEIPESVLDINSVI